MELFQYCARRIHYSYVCYPFDIACINLKSSLKWRSYVYTKYKYELRLCDAYLNCSWNEELKRIMLHFGWAKLFPDNRKERNLFRYWDKSQFRLTMKPYHNLEYIYCRYFYMEACRPLFIHASLIHRVHVAHVIVASTNTNYARNMRGVFPPQFVSVIMLLYINYMNILVCIPPLLLYINYMNILMCIPPCMVIVLIVLFYILYAVYLYKCNVTVLL